MTVKHTSKELTSFAVNDTLPNHGVRKVDTE